MAYRASDVSQNWRLPQAQSPDVQQQISQNTQQQMFAYLQTLNMQTMEMQERLMAQISQQLASVDVQAPANDENEVRQRRSAALSNLQRAQKQRSVSPEPEYTPPARTNRLSWQGTESILEQAKARRAAQSPPLAAQSPPLQSALSRGHRRANSSTSSSASVMLSESHKRVTSPSTGLTLVLSQPGDSYPSPTLGRSTSKPSALYFDQIHPTDADSAHSSPRTPQSEDNSEVYSFESITSVHTEDGKEGDVFGAPSRLNPSAPAFLPHPRSVSAPLPRSASPVAKPVRQPKGPCPDEQLDTMNFACRVRARAFTHLKSRLRATSPMNATFSI